MWILIDDNAIQVPVGSIHRVSKVETEVGEYYLSVYELVNGSEVERFRINFDDSGTLCLAYCEFTGALVSGAWKCDLTDSALKG